MKEEELLSVGMNTRVSLVLPTKKKKQDCGNHWPIHRKGQNCFFTKLDRLANDKTDITFNICFATSWKGLRFGFGLGKV